jgi:hypothetical protein
MVHSTAIRHAMKEARIKRQTRRTAKAFDAMGVHI